VSAITRATGLRADGLTLGPAFFLRAFRRQPASSAAPGPGHPALAGASPAWVGTRVRAAIDAMRMTELAPDPGFEQVAERVEAQMAKWPPMRAPVLVPAALVCAVIHEESGGDPDAFPEHPERDGASFGLMQLLLPTARAVGFTRKAPLLFDPVVNVELGILYLASLYQQYRVWRLVLIAYNGGPRAAWLAQHHLPCGPAGHYADVVMALWSRYEIRAQERARAKPGSG